MFLHSCGVARYTVGYGYNIISMLGIFGEFMHGDMHNWNVNCKCNLFIWHYIHTVVLAKHMQQLHSVTDHEIRLNIITLLYLAIIMYMHDIAVAT